MSAGPPRIAGVVLAGGQGRRFGGANKALLTVGSEFLFELGLRRLGEQLATLGVNANRDEARFLASGAPLVPDGIGGGMGPLDGVLGAMRFARAMGCSLVVTVPVDTPFFPDNLAAVLASAAQARPAYAVDADGNRHGACAAWPATMDDRLAEFLRAGGRKVQDFHEQAGSAAVRFDDCMPECFLNINTPEDLALARQILLEQGN